MVPLRCSLYRQAGPRRCVMHKLMNCTDWQQEVLSAGLERHGMRVQRLEDPCGPMQAHAFTAYATFPPARGRAAPSVSTRPILPSILQSHCKTACAPKVFGWLRASAGRNHEPRPGRRAERGRSPRRVATYFAVFNRPRSAPMFQAEATRAVLAMHRRGTMCRPVPARGPQHN